MAAQRTRNGLGRGLFPVAVKSDQPALLDRGFDEACEQRMGLERAALELRMELDANEPRVVGTLDDLRQLAVRRHAREEQARTLERVLVVDVHLVAVAVP